MKLDANEQRLGYTWLVCAGAFAIVLSLGLYRVNNTLHESKAEEEKGDMLRELRTAQFGLPSHVTDERQLHAESVK